MALAAALAAAGGADAAHEGTSTLAFAPVAGSPAPSATGEGVVDYRGGGDEDSRWTVQLRFAGLTPGASYAAVVQGRFGEDGTAEATAFTGLCVVTADAAGAGGCWWYLVEMRRLNVVQLRAGGVDGPPVLQATRSPQAAGPGSITSVPNAFSPPEPPASPPSSPAAPPAAATAAQPVVPASPAGSPGVPASPAGSPVPPDGR